MQDSSPSERSRTIRPPRLSPSPSTTQQTEGTAPPDIIESNEVWFEDGTLIVSSSNVYFRVYKGILAFHSPVFEDMVNFPQPRNVDEFEGCPVVRMYDDPTDVMHFLKALHDVSYFDLFLAKSIKWTCFSAVLRLSTKYQVEFLRRRAYALLSSLYPTTLAKWDARDSITSLESFEARPFAVYNLAKQTDLPSVLPAALYLCADSQDINYILEGLESHDGKHIQLEWSDKKACIRAREVLSMALRTRMFAFLTGQISFPGCRSTSLCNNTRVKWLQGVEGSLGSGVFSVSFPWDQFRFGLCDHCFNTSQNHYDTERSRLWDELPEILGLPPWSQLPSES